MITTAPQVTEEPVASTAALSGWESWRLSPPPEGSDEVGRWVWNKYQVMRRHRDKQGLPELWAHNHELYRNRIFRRKSKYQQVTVNLFFKVINAFKANLTDNKPRASIMPRGDTPDEVADAWQARYDIWWDKTQQQGCLTQSVGRSELYGYQCDQMLFNPDLEGGLGDIQTKRWDNFSVLFWPGHLDIQTQPMMCAYEALELGEIYARWPEAEKKVTADAEYSEIVGEARNWTRGNRTDKLRPFGSAPGYYVPEGGEYTQMGGEGLQRALVIYMWVKDYTMHWVNPLTGEPAKKGQVFQDQETGEQIEAEQWSKYPGFIRCLIVANKGGIVLEDRPNPSINPNLPREVACNCYLWDKFPFIKRLSYSDDISEYGLSIIEQIETLVIEVSKKMTIYGVNLDMVCRSPLILPQNCGVRRNDVNNLPARIWEPVPSMANSIRFLQAPQVTQDILAYIELTIRLVDMISGITDVSEGRRPSGVTAASAIQALQEKAQTIYREKIRSNDLYLEDQGRMFISLGQNWYTEEQMMRYEGKSQENFIPFRGTDFQGELNFAIEAGSTLPNNRAVRQQQLIELRKNGEITRPTLLKELAIPNADEEDAKLNAGPVGEIMQRLQQSGLFDEQTLQAAEQIAGMDPKEFQKAFSQNLNPYEGS